MSVSLQTDTLTPFNWCHIVTISLSPGWGDAVTLSPAQLRFWSPRCVDFWRNKMNAHQPPNECQAAKPECVTSLTTVRHSEGPPVADLLTIIKVNTGHTPAQCSAQSCSGTIFIWTSWNWWLSAIGAGTGARRGHQRDRGWRFTTGDAESWSSRLLPADRGNREIRFEWIKNMSSLSLKED